MSSGISFGYRLCNRSAVGSMPQMLLSLNVNSFDSDRLVGRSKGLWWSHNLVQCGLKSPLVIECCIYEALLWLRNLLKLIFWWILLIIWRAFRSIVSDLFHISVDRLLVNDVADILMEAGLVRPCLARASACSLKGSGLGLAWALTLTKDILSSSASIISKIVNQIV